HPRDSTSKSSTRSALHKYQAVLEPPSGSSLADPLPDGHILYQGTLDVAPETSGGTRTTGSSLQIRGADRGVLGCTRRRNRGFAQGAASCLESPGEPRATQGRGDVCGRDRFSAGWRPGWWLERFRFGAWCCPRERAR